MKIFLASSHPMNPEQLRVLASALQTGIRATPVSIVQNTEFKTPLELYYQFIQSGCGDIIANVPFSYLLYLLHRGVAPIIQERQRKARTSRSVFVAFHRLLDVKIDQSPAIRDYSLERTRRVLWVGRMGNLPQEKEGLEKLFGSVEVRFAYENRLNPQRMAELILTGQYDELVAQIDMLWVRELTQLGIEPLQALRQEVSDPAQATWQFGEKYFQFLGFLRVHAITFIQTPVILGAWRVKPT